MGYIDSQSMALIKVQYLKDITITNFCDLKLNNKTKNVQNKQSCFVVVFLGFVLIFFCCFGCFVLIPLLLSSE